MISYRLTQVTKNMENSALLTLKSSECNAVTLDSCRNAKDIFILG